MKHLPRPASVASQEAETVAYVCQTESDDGKPYELPPASDTRENLPFWQYERHHPSPKQELESFFQTWLFFGLINEIHGDLYSANDFVRAAADDTSQVVTISQLLGIIDIWIQNVHSGDLRPSYDNVAEGLRLTHESLRATGLTSDLTLMLSIAATGELLEYAANKAFHIGNFVEDYKCPSSWRILFNESLWEASMREADVPSRHLRCDEQKCSAYQNSCGKYETRHVATDCILSTDAIAIDGILKKGQLPLLRIVPGQTLAELAGKILDSKPTSRYVALSHVWADGMGNPTANSLPRCQLLQLYGFLQHQDLATDAGDAQGDLLLWCDTLCCPVEPKEAKDRALTYMRRTYEDATHVLVLDTSLRLQDSATLSPEELCVRIFACGWMRRLWTLQEGSLPSEKWRLWFQFRDRAVNLRPLWQNALDVLQNQVGRRSIAVEIISRIRAFTAFSQGKVYDSNGLGADLALVEAALKHRSVSVPSDEPLLISNLLAPQLAESEAVHQLAARACDRNMDDPEYKTLFDTLQPEILRIAMLEENEAALAAARQVSGKIIPCCFRLLSLEPADLALVLLGTP